jgi:hypothetical protein
MLVADGIRPEGSADAGEVDRFRELTKAVRSAGPGDVVVPSFDAMWAGVESRLAARTSAEVQPEGLGSWLEALMGRRPLFALAPVGALLVALVLGMIFLGGNSPLIDNRSYVDSYDVDSGTILIDQDPDDPARATVIWYVEEG